MSHYPLPSIQSDPPFNPNPNRGLTPILTQGVMMAMEALSMEEGADGKRQELTEGLRLYRRLLRKARPHIRRKGKVLHELQVRGWGWG